MGLNSISTIQLVDMLCEGPIEGIIGNKKGVYLDETPIQDPTTGDLNFPDNKVSFDRELGTPNQGRLTGFLGESGDEVSTNITINSEIGSNYSEKFSGTGAVQSRDYGAGQVVRSITDTSVTSFECLFTIPALFSTAEEGLAKGQLFSATVSLEIWVQGVGEGYNRKWEKSITGISTTNYQLKSPKIELANNGPWNIKIKKITKGEDDFEIKWTDFEDVDQTIPIQDHRGNRIFWTSLLNIVDVRHNYAHTALVGLNLSTEEFTSLPTRAYLVKGLMVQVPHNSIVREDGSLEFSDAEFDGSLKGPVWTTCPVCIFYDMLISKRYGCSLDSSTISWVDLYPLCRYSNQLIYNPDGSNEPRFAMNTVIGSQSEAFNVLQDLCSVFRGMTYWASNGIQVTADHGELTEGDTTDPVHLYTNSSVTDGVFNYSGTSLKTRSTSVRVRYNDPDNMYKSNFVVVEDYDLITKYGFQEKEIIAFGCTSKWQAQRLGRWMMKAEEVNAEVVTFTVGLEGIAVFPGQVFVIADEMRQGARLAGRVSSASTTAITTDQTITLPSGSDHKMKCVMPDGDVEERTISSVSGAIVTCVAFSAAPQAQSVWSISSSSVTEQKFRCLSIDENGEGLYAITATQFNDSIYQAIDKGTDLEYLDISVFDEAPSTPSNLSYSFKEIHKNNNTVNRLTWSWSRGSNSASITYELRWKLGSGSYTKIIDTTNTIYDIDGIQEGRRIVFQVRAIGKDPFHKRSRWTTKDIITPAPDQSGGEDNTSDTTETTLLPPDPQDVQIIVSSTDDTLSLLWTIPSDWPGNRTNLDALVRHSVKTDGTGSWVNSTLLRKVQAINNSVVLPMMSGEYMVKFQDKNRNKSTNEAGAVINLPDSIPRLSVESRREDGDTPPFQGEKIGCRYSSDFDALILDSDSLWDDFQPGVAIDSWPGSTIDFLGDQLEEGTYHFINTKDLGGIFTVIFKRVTEIRSIFPDDTIDVRNTNIDLWTDFDGSIPDDTTADMYFRKTNTALLDGDYITENSDAILLEDGSDLLLESDTTYGDWIPMETGRFTGRLFQFKAELSTTDTDQTPLIDQLGYKIEIESRTATNTLSSGTASSKAVTFGEAFYETPKVTVSANDMASGDFFAISSLTRTGFSIVFKNSSNAVVDRTFTYQAVGYGAEQS